MERPDGHAATIAVAVLEGDGESRRSECSRHRSDAKVEACEPKFVRQMTLAEFDQLFPYINSCKRYLKQRPWPNVPRCREREGFTRHSSARECHKCGPHPYSFSVYVGTVFGNTNYSLRTWFQVLYLMLTSKKGISALQNRLGGYRARRRVRLLPPPPNSPVPFKGFFNTCDTRTCCVLKLLDRLGRCSISIAVSIFGSATRDGSRTSLSFIASRKTLSYFLASGRCFVQKRRHSSQLQRLCGQEL